MNVKWPQSVCKGVLIYDPRCLRQRNGEKKLQPLTFIRRQLFKARSGDLMTKTCLQLNRQQIAILEKRFEHFCLRRNLKKS